MSQCVPDWDRDRGRGCGDESGGYSPDVRGVGGPVPREGHTGNELFTGAADDVWPWFVCVCVCVRARVSAYMHAWPARWDWDLDDVSELKWADGQPRVLQASTVSKPTTPTRTATATATVAATPAPKPFQPTDINTCGVEDFDLERWLCTAPDEGGRHPAAAGANHLAGADAIVPGSTARLPGAAESASCLLVPDVLVPVEAAPAASCSLGTGPRRRPQARAAGEGGGCREQLRRVRRHRAQQQKHRKQYHVEELQVACGRQQGEGEQRQDDISGRCSAPATKARCRSALSERKRRDKFNQNIRTLQKLVPNCGKVDKVSILDEVIKHVRQLQAQTQMHMMAGADARLSVSPPPVIMPAPAAPMAAYMQQQFQIMAQMAAQMSQMFRMGLAGANSFFPQPPSPLMNFSSPTLAADQQMLPPSGGGRSSPQ